MNARLNGIKLTYYEIDTLYSILDTDLNGGISFSEFFPAAVLTKHICDKNRAGNAFHECDLDAKGGLKVVQLTAFMFRDMKTTEEELRQMFDLDKKDDLNFTITI